ncbi:dephospho-CoA kinase [Spiroplasma cantharicola]|uniref:Dephospho-CoA kinase n=1 Tax=Spiroplasma cantharicola TaxID=362837 RepID=A0A0M4JIJ3_9MOLU|nr:dephospho-CoA kinase [Spiroplasma cantharicola]ALD66441.1 dephospho-CoA kinase [Spiroplasma cantharicola]
MKIIGVSGFIGTGKTTMLEYLIKNPKIKVIEADKVSKDILYDVKILNFIKKFMPEAISENKINRSILRGFLFNNHKLNEKFTKIAWPLISKEINKIIAYEKDAELIFVEAAVISGINVKFDKKILLVMENDQRVKIVKKRDNRELEEIESITAFQLKKLKKTKFDYILKNNQSKSKFFKEIDNLIKLIEEG